MLLGAGGQVCRVQCRGALRNVAASRTGGSVDPLVAKAWSHVRRQRAGSSTGLSVPVGTKQETRVSIMHCLQRACRET